MQTLYLWGRGQLHNGLNAYILIVGKRLENAWIDIEKNQFICYHLSVYHAVSIMSFERNYFSVVVGAYSYFSSTGALCPTV